MMSDQFRDSLIRAVRDLYLPRHLPPPVAVRTSESVAEKYAKYFSDPVGFCADVLGVTLTPDQQQIVRSLPGRVKVESGHNVGKSFVMACAAWWWMCTRNPGVIICNAPSARAVEDVLWVEIRLLWQRAKEKLPDWFVGPKAPEMYDTPDHWAKGYTTSRGESYQGRHRENMLFLFDEDEGIDPIYWTTTSTMYQPDQGHGWLACCNPVTTSTQSYLEGLATDIRGNPKWKSFRLSSLSHPNITASLEGRPLPVPGAVTVGQAEQWVKDWTTPIDPADATPQDVEWPPGSGVWYRPGPTFKSRVLGLRPTEGVDTVWSLAAFEMACRPRWDPYHCWRRNLGIQIGLDCAGFGDDDSVFHVKTGGLSLHHEGHNGWGPDKLAGRLAELCREWASWYNSLASADRPPIYAQDVTATIEFDGGLGVGVHSHGYTKYPRWRGVTMGAASNVLDLNGNSLYLNVRAEGWFESARLAASGDVDLSRLPREVLDKLRVQLLTPFYVIRPDGSRQVESKKDIKKRLGRSPDDADALILSHIRVPDASPSVIFRES